MTTTKPAAPAAPRTYTLTLNDWEMELLTNATEKHLLDCEMRLDFSPTETDSKSDYINHYRTTALLQKLENVQYD